MLIAARTVVPRGLPRAAGLGTCASTSRMALQVERVPCLSDNYAVWLVHEPLSKLTAVVDPAEVQPVVAALKSKGWQLSHIWNTHHHWDHTGGNKQLKQLFPDIQVLGPAADKARIPAIDVAVADGGSFQFGGVEVRVFDTPGHTRGHIVFWAPQASALFSGATTLPLLLFPLLLPLLLFPLLLPLLLFPLLLPLLLFPLLLPLLLFTLLLPLLLFPLLLPLLLFPLLLPLLLFPLLLPLLLFPLLLPLLLFPLLLPLLLFPLLLPLLLFPLLLPLLLFTLLLPLLLFTLLLPLLLFTLLMMTIPLRSGDTLFALGCGRLFEGSPAQMWHSLSKLLPLPDETQVFCAHEYTQSNARFAVSVDPDNAALRLRKDEVDKLRAQGLPTVPSSLGEEKATNPFLRPHDAGIRSCLGVGPEASDVEVFTRLRHAKDSFH
ncbi:hypothetical protein QJQ45_028707 [Haematococcus lacustris]|nr:hypothetical protein QJQ45_028707 [Haematococcus lacustris]